MKNWWKRFEAYNYKLTGEDRPPIISFALDIFRCETRPFNYFSTNDTNRWKSLAIHLQISLYMFVLSVPYKKLEDHKPSEFTKKLRGI